MKLLYNPTQLTCNLTIGDFPPCEGIQKITGFSRGWHHWNSIRLGYNRSENSDVIRLWLYTYIRGKQKSKVIGYGKAGESFNVMLTWDYVWAEAIVGNQSALIYNGNHACKLGYQLYPYAEIDGTEKRKPFEVDIKDVVVR